MGYFCEMIKSNIRHATNSGADVTASPDEPERTGYD